MLDRIEELKHNEQLLYNCIEYLINLWQINGDNEEIKNNFKNIGFTEEDLKQIDFMFE